MKKDEITRTAIRGWLEGYTGPNDEQSLLVFVTRRAYEEGLKAGRARAKRAGNLVNELIQEDRRKGRTIQDVSRRCGALERRLSEVEQQHETDAKTIKHLHELLEIQGAKLRVRDQQILDQSAALKKADDAIVAVTEQGQMLAREVADLKQRAKDEPQGPVGP